MSTKPRIAPWLWGVAVAGGRGGDESKVIAWLQAGAGVPDSVGLAVGRTIWWGRLESWLAGQSKDETEATIADKYRRLVDAYDSATGSHKATTRGARG